MEGDYFGYDGPCPPWNDERLHHYNFTLYATDLAVCPVPDRFTDAEIRQAIDGHVLAEASLTGTDSLNAAREESASSGGSKAKEAEVRQ